MTEFHVLIPARLASTRLPRKPLADVAGRALILRVCDRARTAGAASVHVATDSEEVAALVRDDGGSVILTRPDHRSGTDRLAEAAARLGLWGDDIVVNLQGDEPEMPSACIRQVAGLLDAHSNARMATLWRALDDEHDWRNPNVVKLVADERGRALYFSRSPIPHAETAAGRALQHVRTSACTPIALRPWRPGTLCHHRSSSGWSRSSSCGHCRPGGPSHARNRNAQCRPVSIRPRTWPLPSSVSPRASPA